jgi:alpha-glucosidase
LRRFLLFFLAIPAFAAALHAQHSSGAVSSTPPADSSPIPGGIRIHSGPILEEITALRDNVIRIRIADGGSLPENASWAVLPAARTSVAATPDSSPVAFGFHTASIRVEVAKDTLALTIRDSSGKILAGDAHPVSFDGHAFRVYKTMPLDEHYFGLGDKTGPLDRREQAFSLWNTDAYRFQESTDPIYKSIPFFLTFRAGVACGLFLDNTWRSSFDFGKELPGVYSFGSVDGPLDYYFIYGPTPRQVVENYAWLTGTPPLPPLWILGFQQSRYSYVPQSRVLEVASRFRADHIPADAIYLDIDFQDKNRPFTVNPDLFPDFKGMIAQLHAENFHLVAITDMHIANYPGHNYAPYDTGAAGDNFVRNPDGSVFSGAVWPGPAVFPDFTRQQTRAWWGTLYHDFHQDGVEGFWNDMNEPSVFSSPTKTMPLDIVHRIDEPGFAPRPATHAEIHNIYGMQNSRATFEGLRTLDPSTRPFVLTRASYAGGQRYAATWTGDNSSTWNHLRMTTFMIENLGLSGFAFTGADVGGFAGTPSTELLTKWLEIAAFQPIDRDHTEKGSGDQEPWVGGPGQEAIRRRFIEERYHLLPYLYTLAEEASRSGLPIVRPLFLEYPNAAADGHPLDNDAPGEFLVGHDLLVAAPPFPDEDGPYDVVFPTPAWYNYWTGERIARPAPAPVDPLLPPSPLDLVPLRIQARPALDTLPVFVRAGAIIPIEPLVQSTNETPQGPLTLRVYAGSGAESGASNGASSRAGSEADSQAGNGTGSDCEGSLYLDDGHSYDYQQGKYLRMKFSCTTTPNGFHLHADPQEGSYPPWWKEIRIELYGWKPSANTVSINGQPSSVPVANLDHGISITLPDHGQGFDLDLK